MKKVQEHAVRKTHTVATSRIHWQLLIGLVAPIAVMSVVVLSGEELKHVPPAATSYTVLYSFAGPPTDGGNPLGGLVRDAAGNLYGTTSVGGGSRACSGGCGTVFKLCPTGTETVLHSFLSYPGDGRAPSAGLVRDASGNLYGTTSVGGLAPFSWGVVFKLSPTAKETILHSFTLGSDGGLPLAGLIQDAAGNLYGTTFAGGSSACGVSDCGVVFELIRCDSEPSGYEFKVLAKFTGGADGANPVAGLVRDSAGNLYGTTANGGGYSGSDGECNDTGAAPGCGTVFKVCATGTKTILHRFTGGADGLDPLAGLIQDAAGNLYGTTHGSFACCNFGTVFNLSPSGTFTVLHIFDPGSGGGTKPSAGLIRDAAGNLYGTTSEDGAIPYADGTVFKLSATGTETVLYSFCGGADGGYPRAGLIQDAAGNLYGTTPYDGASVGVVCGAGATGNGVVFRLAP